MTRRGSVDLVNTFVRVLNCISDGHLPDKAPRQFVVSHADMKSFHEYTGEFRIARRRGIAAATRASTVLGA